MTIEAPNGNYSLPASLVQREVDLPSGEDGGIVMVRLFFLQQFFSENYNPSVASGDSSLYTREPLGERTSLPPLCKGRWICRQAKTEGLQVSIVFSAAVF